MAESKKISELPAAANVSDLDTLAAVPGGTGTTSSLTILQVKNHILSASTFLNRAGMNGGGVLDPISTVGTDASVSQKVLGTYTMPAGTLHTNGMGIKIYTRCIYAANNNQKNVEIKFSTTSFTVGGSGADVNAKKEFAEHTIIRLTATTVRWRGQSLFYDSATLKLYAANSIFDDYDDTVANMDSTDIVISINGTNGVATANDIQRDEFIVKLF